MSTGDLIAIISGVLIPVSLALIAGWARTLSRLNGIEMKIQRLTLAQTALTQAQSALTDTHVKLVDENEELDDAVNQLQLATQRLRDRMDAHKGFREVLHHGEG